MSSSNNLICAVYKSLLRVSKNGHYPEVFGNYATGIITSPTSIPSTPKQTRQALRTAFINPENEQIDMFDALRKCNQLASILRPNIDNLNEQSIPIFDFSLSTALIGEQIQFNFFEPRYLALCKQVISIDGDGIFILRGNLSNSNQNDNANNKVSILLKILNHLELDGVDGTKERVLVECMGGPRVKILQQESVYVGKELPDLMRATKIDLECDKSLENEGKLNELKGKCLDLLLELATFKVVLSMGVPPFDYEAFSFWALQFVLVHNDMSSRWLWLECKSTEERLQFVVDTLLELKRRKGVKSEDSK